MSEEYDSAHWRVYRNDYNEWCYQLIDEDGTVLIKNVETYNDRASAMQAMLKVRSLSRIGLPVDREPYDSEVAEGERIDKELEDE